MIYTNKMKEAIYFASTKHKNQKRKILNYPYISHPLSAMYIVSHYTDDENVLLGAILHDTVEDTDTTLDEIEKNFGKKVRYIVDLLSEDKSIKDKKVRFEKQLERFKDASHDVLLIKLADIIVNSCDITLVLKYFKKEEYLKVFGGDIPFKIEMAKKRLKVIEEAWNQNPLLEEAWKRFRDYKKSLEDAKLVK